MTSKIVIGVNHNYVSLKAIQNIRTLARIRFAKATNVAGSLNLANSTFGGIVSMFGALQSLPVEYGRTNHIIESNSAQIGDARSN